jgi:hypothetical protein
MAPQAEFVRHQKCPRRQSDRAIRLYKSMNSLDPVYIALRGKTDFWYDLSDFQLHDGEFRVEAHIRAVSCSDLFDGKNPTWLTMEAANTFNLRPTNGG